MTRFGILKLIFITLLLSFNQVLAGEQSEMSSESGPSPHPQYTPGDVVRIQMIALQTNNQPSIDAGIEIAFRFASPGNKANTGPLDKFIGILKNPSYKDMLNYASVEFGRSRKTDDIAIIPVLIKQQNGNLSAYAFRLSRQKQPPFENCWMTDGVSKIPVPQNPESSDQQI